MKHYKNIIILLLFVLSGFACTFLFLFKKNSRQSIKIGILLAQKGPFAKQELPTIKAILLAIDEINHTGGINGHPLVPVMTMSELNDADFTREAELFITNDKVSCLLGCRNTTSRKHVKDIVEKHNNLLLYPVQWEGIEQSPNIVYTGAIPNQQIIPVLMWAHTNFGKKITIIGADDVFTHIIQAIVTHYIQHLNMQLLETHFIPSDQSKYASIISALQKNKPDIVLNLVADRDQTEFFKELYATGLTPQKIPLISLVFSDNDQALTQEHLIGSYVSKPYFQSFKSRKNKEFIKKMHTKYPEQPIITVTMETAYTSVHLWAQAARQAYNKSSSVLLPFLHKQTFDAPEGAVAISQKTNCCWHTVRITKVMYDGTLNDIWSSQRPIEPLPYPPFNTKKQWDDFLDNIYKQWKVS